MKSNCQKAEALIVLLAISFKELKIYKDKILSILTIKFNLYTKHKLSIPEPGNKVKNIFSFIIITINTKAI